MKSIRMILGGLVAAGLCAACVITGASLLGEQRTGVAVARGMDAKDLSADILPPPLYVVEARLILSEAVEGGRSADDARKELARLVKDYETRFAHWRSHPFNDPVDALILKQDASARAFLAIATDLLASIENNGADGNSQRLTEADSAFGAHRKDVDNTVKAAALNADKAMAVYAATQSQVLWLQGVVFALSAVLLTGLGIWARRTVWAATGGEPAVAAAIANAVAEGQLNVHVPVAPGDTRSVMAALARMCENLGGIVQDVRNGSDAIARDSAEIATGNADLSVRTEQQAGNVQQTASAMEQFAGTVKHTATAAGQASELAREAAEVATKGAQEVARVVETMNGITTSSRRIAEITSLIDGIAFQTNILALNAAVEAARAGDQGRGFAVVAGEVRLLAQRSANAAKEISQLTGQSTETVEAGAELVRNAGATMTEIVGRVERVNQLIHDISTAAREQTQGIDMVGRAISELDSATQQNAALVEQSANAAESLSQQARGLVESVQVFQLHGERNRQHALLN